MLRIDHSFARRLIVWRQITQSLFLGLFVFLLWNSVLADPIISGSTSLFFQTDPFWSIIQILGGSFSISLVLAAIPVILTLILGRFFCGWICPMGTLNQFSSWVFYKSSRQTHASKSQTHTKYLILFATCILALFGFNIASWIDPFSILSRGLSGGMLTSGILIGILFLNYRYKRFFCTILCPLGALYGLLSRWGIFRIKRSTSCNDCGLCKSDCSYDMNIMSAFHSKECTTCLNCLGNCKNDIAQLTWVTPNQQQIEKYSPSRRSALTTLGGTLAFVSLAKVSGPINGYKRIPYLRPPGAVKEEDFTSLCLRCGNCIVACPSKIIHHSLSEAGWEGLWTPILDFEYKGCEWECISCLDVCPSGAIEKLSLTQKQEYIIGTVVINKTLCYTYANGYDCTKCIEACTTSEKALFTRPVQMINYRGQEVIINQMNVDVDLCIGCGLCVPVCPRKDEAALFVRYDG